MNTYKKSYLIFLIVLFMVFGLFFPAKTARAGGIVSSISNALKDVIVPILTGAIADPIMQTVLIVDYNSCYVNWYWGCDDNIASNPTTTATLINGACGNTSSASGINTCSSGTLGENHAQSGGIYDWYCMGINGGSNSGLCRYTPAATTATTTTATTTATTTTTTTTTNTTSSNCNSHNCSHSLTNAEATCYRNANSDLQSSYSAASFSGLRQHWSTFGCKEGRNYCCSTCGDGSCNSSEDCSNCPSDCGNCCSPNCNDSGNYCSGAPYPGNCGQTCTGTGSGSCGDPATVCPGPYNDGCGGTCWGTKDCAPTLSFTATSPIDKGAESTLTWTPQDATGCWGWGLPQQWPDGDNNIDFSNNTYTKLTGPLNESQTYNITCWNNQPGPHDITITRNVCVKDCSLDSGSHCDGVPYTGNCGQPQTCIGKMPPYCENFGDCNKECGGGIKTHVCHCQGADGNSNITKSEACNSDACPGGYREVTPW